MANLSHRLCCWDTEMGGLVRYSWQYRQVTNRTTKLPWSSHHIDMKTHENILNSHETPMKLPRFSHFPGDWLREKPSEPSLCQVAPALQKSAEIIEDQDLGVFDMFFLHVPISVFGYFCKLTRVTMVILETKYHGKLLWHWVTISYHIIAYLFINWP